MKRLKILSSNNNSFAGNDNNDYNIDYGTNKIIYALENTIGIMCFDNLTNVKTFLNMCTPTPTQCFELIKLQESQPLLSELETLVYHENMGIKKYIVGKICEIKTFEEIETPKLIPFGNNKNIHDYYQHFKKLDFDDLLLNIDPIDDTVKAIPSSYEVVFLHKAPPGTICAKKIKVLKEIYHIIKIIL